MTAILSQIHYHVSQANAFIEFAEFLVTESSKSDLFNQEAKKITVVKLLA